MNVNGIGTHAQVQYLWFVSGMVKTAILLHWSKLKFSIVRRVSLKEKPFMPADFARIVHCCR